VLLASHKAAVSCPHKIAESAPRSGVNVNTPQKLIKSSFAWWSGDAMQSVTFGRSYMHAWLVLSGKKVKKDTL
jgi:hypothetical protein